jgi:hypothetical protein
MKSIQVDSGTAFIDDYSDFCPRCHHMIEPIFVTATANTRADQANIIDVAFKCPRLKCARLFISTYAHEDFTGVCPFKN